MFDPSTGEGEDTQVSELIMRGVGCKVKSTNDANIHSVNLLWLGERGPQNPSVGPTGAVNWRNKLIGWCVYRFCW